MPFCRDADIHIDGDRYIRYGEHDGGGGGAKSGRNSTMLAENITVAQRALGEKTFTGAVTTSPRLEAVGPHQSDDTGAVRAVNCPPGSYVKENNPHLVPDPPYHRNHLLNCVDTVMQHVRRSP
jgi:hypothetical protein